MDPVPRAQPSSPLNLSDLEHLRASFKSLSPTFKKKGAVEALHALVGLLVRARYAYEQLGRPPLVFSPIRTNVLFLQLLRGNDALAVEFLEECSSTPTRVNITNF